MALNKYQSLLQKQLYFCNLALYFGENDIRYRHRSHRDEIKRLAEICPYVEIKSGNINGHVLKQTMTLHEFDQKLDAWIQSDEFVPNLYLIAGEYPDLYPSTGYHFGIENNGEHIYVYGKEPWTDMPVYQIQDNKLLRIHGGEIPADPEYPITPEIDQKIRDGIAHQVYFLP